MITIDTGHKAHGSKINMKRLKWVIKFLEEDLTIQKLESNPHKTLKLGKGLRDVYLPEKEAETWNQDFFSDNKMKEYKTIFEKSADIDMAPAIIGGLAKNIYSYHHSLRNVWEGLKESLRGYRENPMQTSSRFSVKIAIETDMRSDILRLKPGSAYIEFRSGETSVVYLHYAMYFLSLFEGLPFSRICECKDCDRWFISDYRGKKRQKDYCSNRCASRANKYDMRHNPDRIEEYEKEKEYQRNRYRQKVLGK